MQKGGLPVWLRVLVFMRSCELHYTEESVFDVSSSICSFAPSVFIIYLTGIGDKKMNKSWSLPEMPIDPWERQTK